MDIDFRALLVFRHLARTGSFTETGRRWNISQPAVSLMIGRLESEAGLILLERSSTGGRLTAAGARFLERADDVCDTYLTFIGDMCGLRRRMAREVLVGIDRSEFGERTRQRLLEAAPPDGVTMTFVELGENWAEALEATQLDVVVAGRFLRNGLTPGIQEAALHKERGITVAWNPDFYPFDSGKFSFPEVLRSSVLLPDNGVITGFADSLALWCEHAYGMQPVHTVAFPSETAAAAAAAAGMGVLLGAGDTISRLEGSTDGLVHVRTFEFLLPEAYTYGVYCRSDESSRDIMSVAACVGKIGKKSVLQ